ncbi:hypothetical protein Q8791_29000 [Nocardiopsis sp. CT-R113]|uniref:Uncharacterized protein n=1 Tax=Nocardiopsis codii TaxID=3065942 RepID=A0ABU7KGA4_9ACTN|nr:hypothetical protein [Nocardiopsis sp. CT-R113]MEE2041270.1 hypothetical protein [Nocardiopsis sp. CT-R113]
MGVATELMRARADGAAAARRGDTRGTCPHPPAADAPPQARALFGLWQAGYDSVRPLPIDYSDGEG